MIPQISPGINPGSTSSSNILLEAALAYLAYGLNVLPIYHPDTILPPDKEGRPRDCTSGKIPAAGWKPFQRKRQPTGWVEDQFRRPEVWGVGVILGPVSGGIAVADFDSADAYETWKATYPWLAATLPTASTGRNGGGFHVWHRVEGKRRSTNKVNFYGNYKALGGFAMLPPSPHKLGPLYRWVIPLPPLFSDIPLVDPVAVGFLPPTPTPAPITNPSITTSPTPIPSPPSISLPSPGEAEKKILRIGHVGVCREENRVCRRAKGWRSSGRCRARSGNGTPACSYWRSN
jgi:hypothetical protein